jgi:predicted amidohydrolase
LTKKENKMHLTVAGYQMAVGTDVGQNTSALCKAIQQAKSAGADILLTPEGSLSGYTPHFDPPAVVQGLVEVTHLARQVGIGLALGTCFVEADGLTYNQVRFYTQDGGYLGFHSKILRCGSLDEPVEGEINDYACTELRTFLYQDIRIGGLICNDLWANPQCTPMPDPHLSQKLARLGAQVIFHAVNGGRDGSPWSTGVAWNFHEANLRMRAAAGKIWIVTVDSSAPTHLPCAAPGGVIDPQGNWVCRADPQGEQLFVYSI